MKNAPGARRGREERPRTHYLLRLYMAGDGPNSRQALSNLRRLCDEHLEGRCTIETVDVVKHHAAAVRDNILVTPALVLVAPFPKVTVLGTLSDQKKVLLALRLTDGNA